VSFAAINLCVASQRVFIVVIDERREAGEDCNNEELLNLYASPLK
jgi:hypothetical protein